MNFLFEVRNRSWDTLKALPHMLSQWGTGKFILKVVDDAARIYLRSDKVLRIIYFASWEVILLGL